jgi:hypothetical protein
MARQPVLCPTRLDRSSPGFPYPFRVYRRFPKPAGLKRIHALAFSCCTAFFGGNIFRRDYDRVVLLFWWGWGFSHMDTID